MDSRPQPPNNQADQDYFLDPIWENYIQSFDFRIPEKNDKEIVAAEDGLAKVADTNTIINNHSPPNHEGGHFIEKGERLFEKFMMQSDTVAKDDQNHSLDVEVGFLLPGEQLIQTNSQPTPADLGEPEPQKLNLYSNSRLEKMEGKKPITSKRGLCDEVTLVELIVRDPKRANKIIKDRLSANKANEKNKEKFVIPQLNKDFNKVQQNEAALLSSQLLTTKAQKTHMWSLNERVQWKDRGLYNYILPLDGQNKDLRNNALELKKVTSASASASAHSTYHSSNGCALTIKDIQRLLEKQKR